MASSAPERVYAANREEWREWLSENHAASSRIHLVYFKVGSGRPSVTYDEAVEEALCFGWIDSRVNSIDGESYMQLYTPRRPGSIWSKLNKERVAKVIAEGRMTPAGLAKIEAAKKDGSWAFLDAIDALDIPSDLAEALGAAPAGSAGSPRASFDAYSESIRKRLLYWLATAKRTATREKRIRTIVGWATENKTDFGM